MSGSLMIPNTLAALTGANPLSVVDANFAAVASYVNTHEVTFGTFAARPAASGTGIWYYATDTGVLYVTSNAVWTQVSAAQTVSAFTGLGLSNDSGTPNTVLDIAAGGATSDDATLGNRIVMTLGAAFTKTTGAWVVGSGNGGMASGGAVAIGTVYHTFLIERPDTGVVDVAFDTSVTGANIAANTNAAYTKKRRLGAFKTAAGSTNILAFDQQGGWFALGAPVQELSAAPGDTAAHTLTLTGVPTGVRVMAELSVNFNAVAGSGVYFSSLAVADAAASFAAAPGVQVASINANASGGVVQVMTNTSGQIRYRMSATVVMQVNTLRYFEFL